MHYFLLVVATCLQLAAVAYCVVLLRTHRSAASAWLCLLACLVSMLSWRVAVTTGITPGPAFTTVIAMWGSVGAVLAMFFFSQEVSRRRDAERDRDRLLTSERNARQEAERSNRVKDEFLAVLSHELRTPLSAILGWCAICRASNEPLHVDRAIATIERNARHQARLVDDLLDVSRMHAGSLQLELVPVNVALPVMAAIEAIGPQADAKGLSVAVVIPEDVPSVMGDAGRLQQVVSNLLTNAVKFSTSGGLVRITVSSTPTDATIQVTDSGIGIAPESLPQVFRPFWQADSTRTRRHRGLGLGLAITSTLVRLHGGEIFADSAGIGAGATFTIRLPRACKDAEGVDGPAMTALPVQEEKPLRDIRAVVVEDDADVREMVVRLLEQAGAQVFPLESGAMLQATIAEHRPDILLLDIGMPNEDGYSLIRRIRRSGASQGGDVPAISLTAYAREEDRQQAMDAGFQAHLTKPLNVSLVLATVRALVPAKSEA